MHERFAEYAAHVAAENSRRARATVGDGAGCAGKGEGICDLRLGLFVDPGDDVIDCWLDAGDEPGGAAGLVAALDELLLWAAFLTPIRWEGRDSSHGREVRTMILTTCGQDRGETDCLVGPEQTADSGGDT